MVRLQKFLAECGVASRRGAEELIRDGQVMVNGKRITKMGVSVDPAKDQVRVGKRFVKPAPLGVILFNKPTGVVSTRKDPGERPTVADYLPARFRSYFPVGRLDFDSSGLMILTNDGELADRLLHPRYEVKRVYQVRVWGDFGKDAQERAKKGVRLTDGMARAKVFFERKDHKSTWLEVVIYEGRNKVVRRLMDALGHPVIKLNRVAHGPFKIGGIKSGQIKELSYDDYVAVRAKVMGNKRSSRIQAKPGFGN